MSVGEGLTPLGACVQGPSGRRRVFGLSGRVYHHKRNVQYKPVATSMNCVGAAQIPMAASHALPPHQGLPGAFWHLADQSLPWHHCRPPGSMQCVGVFAPTHLCPAGCPGCWQFTATQAGLVPASCLSCHTALQGPPQSEAGCVLQCREGGLVA